MMSLRPIRKAVAGVALWVAAPAASIAVLIAAPAPASTAPPEITIEKSTNGIDADAAPGPILTPGDAVTWNYLIAVNGPTTMYDLIVSDSAGVVPSCDIDGDGKLDGTHIHPGPLASGDSFHCMAGGTVQPAANGTFSAVGRVKAYNFDGLTSFEDDDPSFYTPQTQFIAQPNISIQSMVNGIDADSSPGPYVAEDSPISWTFVVTNTGNVPLRSISVNNTGGVLVGCGGQSNVIPGPLAPGSSVTCTGTSSAVASSGGMQTSAGTVVATAVDPATGDALIQLSAQDPINYTPVELPGRLAFTGPSDHLGPIGMALTLLGVTLWSTGAVLGRKRRQAQLP